MGTSGSRISKAAGLRTSVIEERRALLQRVLWSRPVEKSGRIREFLSFVCERTLADPSVGIHEQEIGQQVFGRPDGYDTTQDNIVRVTASQARKKLEQYFASEGASEPVVLEIPKGQYTPVFRERVADVAERAAVRAPTGLWRRAILVAAGCAPLLAVAVAILGWQLRDARLATRSELESNPSLNALWSQLLAPQGRTDLVVTDSSLSFFQELLDHQLTLAEYLKPDVWARAAELSSNAGLQAFARSAARHRFTSLANVTFAYRVARLSGRDAARISLYSARDFNIRQMQSDNVILLGSSRANPWVELIADRLNFRYGFDQSLRFSYFENRNPAPGEPRIFRSDGGISYCQIALVPNLSRTGNILTIAGTEVEGTEGGGDFLTGERSLGQLRSQNPIGRDGKLPYFEILLKSNRLGGLAPKFSIVAFRAVRI